MMNNREKDIPPLKLIEQEFQKIQRDISAIKNELRQIKGNPQSKDLLEGFVNKNTFFELIDGARFQGVLKQVDKYNLLIETNGKGILVPKHAIKTMNVEGQ